MCDFQEFFIEIAQTKSSIVKSETDQFRQWLNSKGKGLERIRIFIEADPAGTGHVACSCKLILRLTGKKEAGGMEYGGCIEAVFDDKGSAGVLAALQKTMQGWIPQLADGRCRVGNADLVLMPIRDIKDELILGLTGGRNATDPAAERLKVKYFLRLEPAYWTYNDWIEVRKSGSDGKEIIIKYILDGTSTKPTAFTERAYVYPLYRTVDWEELKTSFSSAANVVNVVQKVLEIRAKSQFWIMPVYLFNTGFASRWVDWMTQLTGSLLFMQKQLGEKACSIILLDVSEITEDMKTGAPNPVPFWEEISKIHQGLYAEEDYVFNIFSGKKFREDYKASIEKRKAFFTEQKAVLRFERFFPDLQAGFKLGEIEKKIDEFLKFPSEDKRIMFLHLGRIPAPLFEYLMCEADLPPLFEGANTANNAVLTGKPYFHRKMQGAMDNPFYPSMVLSPDIAGTHAETMIRAMKYFNAKIYMYETKETDGQNPCIHIGDLLASLFTGNNNGLLKYFSEIGTVYNDLCNDKLIQGICELIKVLRKEGVFPPQPEPKQGLALRKTLLDEWYDKLCQELVMGERAPLLTALPIEGTAIFEAVMGTHARELTVIPGILERRGAQQVYLSGDTDSVLISGMGGRQVELLYSQEDSGGIKSCVTMYFSEKRLSLPGMPWIVMQDPGIYMELSENPDAEGFVKIIGRWSMGEGKEGVPMSLSQPMGSSHWKLEVRWPSSSDTIAEDFCALLGGVSPFPLLPQSFGILDHIGLDSFVMQYDERDKLPDAAGVRLFYKEKVRLGKGVELDQIFMTCYVTAPSDAAHRSVSVGLGGIIFVRPDVREHGRDLCPMGDRGGLCTFCSVECFKSSGSVRIAAYF